MKLLLDTHVFLWFISGDKRLSERARQAIQNRDNSVYLSVASVWEAVVKHQLGKLPFPQPPQEFLPLQRERHHIESLAIDEATVRHLPKLPLLHRDPFDRILVCHALQHSLTIVTVDPLVAAYPVSTMN